MISDPLAAAYALLVLYAQDAYARAPLALAPPLDTRAAGWELLGHIVGRDAVTAAGVTVCYGFLVRSRADPTLHVAVVRGTADAIEWVKDAEFAFVAHPVAGRVEHGFWTVYDRLRYVALGGADAAPLAAGVSAAVGPNTLTIVGHSLGAALATYFAFDVAYLLGDRMDAIILASPHPGDMAFCAKFEERVRRYKLYNYARDVVPRVPLGFGYTHLLQEYRITVEAAQAVILDTPFANHHVTSYAAMLYWAVADWNKFPLFDFDMTQCIIKGNV